MATVDAFIAEIKRSEQAHRAAKILQGERSRLPGHGLEFARRLRPDEALETMNQGGFGL